LKVLRLHRHRDVENNREAVIKTCPEAYPVKRVSLLMLGRLDSPHAIRR
jgi:hypothetical protein